MNATTTQFVPATSISPEDDILSCAKAARELERIIYSNAVISDDMANELIRIQQFFEDKILRAPCISRGVAMEKLWLHAKMSVDGLVPDDELDEQSTQGALDWLNANP